MFLTLSIMILSHQHYSMLLPNVSQLYLIIVDQVIQSGSFFKQKHKTFSGFSFMNICCF